MIDYSFLKPYKLKGRSQEAKFHSEVLHDYWVCQVSRETSLISRKEVLTGKAKFGITGDGKEVPQVAMAKAFKKGDWRSGYYRDQTFMMALGLCSVEQFLAQLYADPQNDPFSGGRQMNAHFATPTIDKDGKWIDHTKQYNVSSDISSTAGQMSRGLGLALASKKFKTIKGIGGSKSDFSRNGKEVSFVTIGDASTSEGVFWESINAATVMELPMLVSVWDDGYGISVPIKLQTSKGSISEALAGFKQKKEGADGMYIYKVKGWDYPKLIEVYEECAERVRNNHRPALVHVSELTQPQGHSTSGSHERYKSKERLAWEKNNDCIKKFGEWITKSGILTKKQLEEIDNGAKEYVQECKKRAWNSFIQPVLNLRTELKTILSTLEQSDYIKEILLELSHPNPVKAEILQSAIRAKIELESSSLDIPDALIKLIEGIKKDGKVYHKYLYSESDKSALNIPVVHPEYSDKSAVLTGYNVLNTFFDATLKKDKRVMAFGEDVGNIGDVNQGFAGLQEKYGEERVFDTGIREWTIMGQAIGLSMRGFKPIAEIQYLDYLIYGLEPLCDDLATVRYRSYNQQQAPAIIRTRGHRLEGIWHAGSPLGMMIHALRGIYICVPRNMVQAMGFYNTLLKSDDPGIVIECLNGYRLKETLPDNYIDYTLPLGVPEVLQEGTDITLVTYGSCVRVAEKALELLAKRGISVELIDVQTLLPFDMEHKILESIKKTNKVLFMDEDVPGGATAFMLQKVVEDQGAYYHLDAQPQTLSAKAHRTPFGSDGDYFTKPNPEEIYEKVMAMVKESEPKRFN